MKNSVARISDFGQSIWLDYIRRKFISSGELKKLIDEDGLKGVTSNPAIFEEAIVKSNDYNETLVTMAKLGISANDIFWSIAIEDVQNAARLFTEVYKKSNGLDGYVSLEVSPDLALNTEGTIAEAHSLWKVVGRKNVMIKVPGTNQGLPAIEQLISEGINVNVTLLFGLDRYREVTEAYVDGLEKRARNGESVHDVTSVASFFLSRIDTLIDPMLEELAKNNDEKRELTGKLVGKVAVACAREAYQIYKNVFGSERFKRLEAKGAKPQRLLWASTGTKNKAYRDVMYVEELIGFNTVNTVPIQTLDAYRDHGKPAARLEQNIEESKLVLQELKELGIDLKLVSEKLEDEGIQKFVQSFEHLLQVIDQKRLEVVS
ncbi:MULTISPECIES: transaldolase [Niastella]|uniref:Transaldolase n=1 Tax=Niastella soli TaxID=2821487 RepID=A0ABS3Z0X5_9BACT|nr:transaldolase [Niastella soli]MBO9203808.1 transaldolase [Niastella soli]